MKKKIISDKDLAQLSVILGQLTLLTGIDYNGKKWNLLPREMRDEWFKTLKDIIDNLISFPQRSPRKPRKKK